MHEANNMDVFLPRDSCVTGSANHAHNLIKRLYDGHYLISED